MHQRTQQNLLIQQHYAALSPHVLLLCRQPKKMKLQSQKKTTQSKHVLKWEGGKSKKRVNAKLKGGGFDLPTSFFSLLMTEGFFANAF